ncbi:MAG: LysM domain-containing protein, partial [Desulfomicrobium sp.]|nr:LysM domain-containing protein [Desulfomicrobium sp.]
AGSVETRTAKAQTDAVRNELVNYQVRQGDSLWGIAKRFGVTPSELQGWNKLARNTHIRPGDTLRVYAR